MEIDAKVKIAVIDNGVNDMLIKYKLKKKVYVDCNNNCIADIKNVNFIHGTICVAIILHYFGDSEIYSLRILDEKGKGLIECLEPALKWCYEKGIYLINLSLGTTDYRDKAKIRKIINFFANRGMCIIAASSNSGYTTFPASFSNVIGVVADGSKYESTIENKLLCVDVIAPSEHEIELSGQSSVVQKSNSYATPFVTGLCGKILRDKRYNHVTMIRNELEENEEKDIIVVHTYCEPDWISNAQIRMSNCKNKKYFYFNVVEDNSSEKSKTIDTIIIDDWADVENVIKLDKHIVYLGGEKIEREFSDRFFWSPYNKRKLINDCVGCDENLDIPVIICEFCEGIDEMFLLTELRRDFVAEEYNIYTVSMCVENVLCDLEYIPEESMEEIDKVRKFICLQTYFKQSDGIVMGGNHEQVAKLKKIFGQADVEIKFRRIEKKYEITLYGEEKRAFMKESSTELRESLIRTIVDKVILILTEGDNE